MLVSALSISGGMMFTTEVAAFGQRTNFEDLDRNIEWERAARILDLDPRMVRRLHKPRMECVSRHECVAGVASLYVAAGPRNCGKTVATIALESGIGAHDVCEGERELQLELALAEVHENSAVIGVQLPSAPMTEQEMWELARQCVPIVSRVLGNTRLVPGDICSAAFANWMAHEAAQYGVKLNAPKIEPEKYCAQRHQSIAESVVQLSAMGLQEKGKKLRGARATVIGLDRMAWKCMQTMHDAGVLMVAVADESGAVIRKAGIDVPPLLQHLESGGLLAEYTDAEHALHSEALAVDADILLLGARGDEITEKNSASVGAAIVIEGQSNGLDSDATDALNDRGVLVVPNRLTRYLQVREEFVHRRPDAGWHGNQGEMLKSAWQEIATIRERHGLALPTATLLLALQRLAENDRTSHP
jgi:glutamate dehydrogenase (NAD(P)+)